MDCQSPRKDYCRDVKQRITIYLPDSPILQGLLTEEIKHWAHPNQPLPPLIGRSSLATIRVVREINFPISQRLLVRLSTRIV